MVADIPAARVQVGEPFRLMRFMIGDFQDRNPPLVDYGSYTAYCNRLAVTTDDGHTEDLTLLVMVRAALLVHIPAITPYCPGETDFADDPDYQLARSGQRWPTPLFSAAFPASPAHLEIWGLPAPRRDASPAVKALSLALTFPDGLEYVAVPSWSDDFHQWQRFVPGPAGGSVPGREDGYRIFVPDDINLLKPVDACLTHWPPHP